MNTFLIGSKDLFEKIKTVINLLSKAIDVKVDIRYKMIELENRRVSYTLLVRIDYPCQMLLGSTLTKEEIRLWLSKGLELYMNDSRAKEMILRLEELEEKLSLKTNILYLQIPAEKIEKSLEDFKKLSILLFKKLDFLVK